MEFVTDILDAQDAFALGFFLTCWIGYVLYSDGKRNMESSLLAATNRYRLQWIRESIKRENRTMDAISVGNLQRSIAFFANTTIFILLGLITMLGYHDKADVIIRAIPFAKPSYGPVWEVKMLLLVLIFIYAFFKYTWSLRQYNYAGIFICALPPADECGDNHESLADRGSYLVGNAAQHFNNGLRAYYFGLAALGWFIHPYIFMAATGWVVFVTYRREFRSATLKNLSR